MKKIFLTGSTGFIGLNIQEHFKDKFEIFAPTHNELDLLNGQEVFKYVLQNEFDVIIHCANVGGGRDSTKEQNIVEKNLRMFFNIVRASGLVDRVFYFGSGAEFDKQRDLVEVEESEFGNVIPKDDYGFAKYVMNKYTEKSHNIYNLRLFGCFGKYEDYRFKFISNSIVKNLLLGQPITIVQDCRFSYLYVNDLMRILEILLGKDKLEYHSYNITPTNSITLKEIAQEISKNVIAQNPNMNYQYTGNNKRLVDEIGYWNKYMTEKEFDFTSYGDSIMELYDWYSKNLDKIDEDAVLEDNMRKFCTVKK